MLEPVKTRWGVNGPISSDIICGLKGPIALVETRPEEDHTYLQQ